MIYHSVVAETQEPLIWANDLLVGHECLLDVANRSLRIAGKAITCCLELTFFLVQTEVV